MAPCAVTDTFNVTMVVLDHLWLRFDPIIPPADSGCASYIFDSEVFTDPADGKNYSVGVLQNFNNKFIDPAAAAEVMQAFGSGFFVGNISGAHLVEALDIFNGEYGEPYDIITNSCAMKLIDVMHYLNLNVTNPDFLAWVGQHLLTPKIIDMVRTSNNIQLLFPGVPVNDILAKTDQELIDALVQYSVQSELTAYADHLAFYIAQNNAPAAAPVEAPVAAAPVDSGSGAAPVNPPTTVNTQVPTGEKANPPSDAALRVINWALLIGVTLILALL